ncbi:MAG TPA: YdcF family protein [Acidobacteriaceae bacterium]|nr:YdcF family protein [Acidobacteriaceae bacterium]
MIVSGDNLRSVRVPALELVRRHPRRALFALGGVLVAGGIAWVVWVNSQIKDYAHRDEARSADAIAVFGAAEYDGRPSPVLRARLDHALNLYERGIAPLVITLGGGYAADEQHSEGGVGEEYLLAHGVPEAAIIAETESDNTEESADRLSVIARANGLKSIVVVSDGSHLFRIHDICQRDGLTVYTSPRPVGRPISWTTRSERLIHEILSYTAWKLHLH